MLRLSSSTTRSGDRLLASGRLFIFDPSSSGNCFDYPSSTSSAFASSKSLVLKPSVNQPCRPGYTHPA
jgi:hypothetical protein